MNLITFNTDIFGEILFRRWGVGSPGFTLPRFFRVICNPLNIFHFFRCKFPVIEIDNFLLFLVGGGLWTSGISSRIQAFHTFTNLGKCRRTKSI